MSSYSQKPNIKFLKEDVIHQMEEIINLMSQASKTLIAENYTNFQQEIDTQNKNVKALKKNVESLELIMVITAPMKAGKSTIINAIVGQKLLPTRTDAMTTLATKVVFKAELKKPTLYLSQYLLSVFRETIQDIKDKIQNLEDDELNNKMSRHGHLKYLLEKIQTDSLDSLVPQTETSGFENIEETLSDMNDTIRLCGLIDITKDPLGLLLEEVPRIETPFWKVQESGQTDNFGNLVIIDTPGSNEAGQENRLTNVVKKQLEKSAIVLIILDFGKIGGEEDERVRAQVNKVIRLHGGKKDNLYVLVNQVDKREKNSRSPEQLQEFVKAQYGIDDVGNKEDINRVFEVSAHWALFSANYFVQQLDQREEEARKHITLIPNIARDLLGVEWQDDIQDVKLEVLNRKVKKLREKSGFDTFLDKAINALMSVAAPKAISEALQLSLSYLEKVLDEVNFRLKSIAQAEVKLQQEIIAIQSKLELLAKKRHVLKKEVENRRVNLFDNMNEIVKTMKYLTQMSLEDYVEKEGLYSSDWFKNKLTPFQAETVDCIQNDASYGTYSKYEIFSRWRSRRSKLTFEYEGKGVYKFNDKSDAENFAELVLVYAVERSEILFANLRQQTEQEIEKSRENIMYFLNQETKQIIEEATKQLGEAFEIDIPLPPQPPLPKIALDLIQPSIDELGEYGYVTETEKYRPFWLLYLFELQRKVQKYKQVGTQYKVSLEQIVPEINELISNNFDRINQGIKKYLNEDIQHVLKVFFDNLESFLMNYRDTMIQSLVDQKKSDIERKELQEQLNNLEIKCREEIKKIKIYIQRTNYYLSQGSHD